MRLPDASSTPNPSAGRWGSPSVVDGRDARKITSVEEDVWRSTRAESSSGWLGLRPGPSSATGARAQAAAQPTTTRDEAELAVLNGRVFTVDDAQPRAEAFAVRGGRFIAVGSTADIRNLVTARTTVIDAGGRDGDARLHRRALPSERHRRAVRRQRQRAHAPRAAGRARPEGRRPCRRTSG